VDIHLVVNPIALRRWSGNRWVFASGPTTLRIGGSSLDLPLSATVAFD
jgi:beta-glucosidase